MTTSTQRRATGNESLIIEASSAITAALASKARRVFAHTRLSIAVQGVGAVAVGLAVLAWPGASLAVLVLLFAVYAAADGVLSILQSLAERDGGSLSRGVISLAVAGAALAWLDAAALGLAVRRRS
jgi:uncharacterized membrane protein HdeD (DUF308 family)